MKNGASGRLGNFSKDLIMSLQSLEWHQGLLTLNLSLFNCISKVQNPGFWPHGSWLPTRRKSPSYLSPCRSNFLFLEKFLRGNYRWSCFPCIEMSPSNNGAFHFPPSLQRSPPPRQALTWVPPVLPAFWAQSLLYRTSVKLHRISRGDWSDHWTAPNQALFLHVMIQRGVYSTELIQDHPEWACYLMSSWDRF